MTPPESNAPTSINVFGSSSSISPQVAQILAVARGNITSTTVNPQPNLVPTVATPALPIQPTPNLLALLTGAQNANSKIIKFSNEYFYICSTILLFFVLVSSINPFANLLSSLTLPMNPLVTSWLSPMNQILTNRLPIPPPVVQNRT